MSKNHSRQPARTVAPVVTILSLDTACAEMRFFEAALTENAHFRVACIHDPADAADGTEPVIVIYDDAVSAIASASEEGVSLEQALEDWRRGAERVTEFCRRQHQGIALIDRRALQRDPRTALAAACAHLGTPLPALLPEQERTVDRDAEVAVSDDLLLLIAAQAVARSAQIGQLARELQAQALPLPRARDFTLDRLEAARQAVASLDLVLSEHAALSSRLSHMTAALSEANEIAEEAGRETELQMLQLLSLQLELEDSFVALKALEEKNAQAESGWNAAYAAMIARAPHTARDRVAGRSRIIPLFRRLKRAVTRKAGSRQ